MTKPHRQRYGLGSFIKKAVKKIGKGAKKVWKSPIGKAALIGGGLYGLNRWGIPGTRGAGSKWWSKAMGTGPGKWLGSAIMGKPGTIAGEAGRSGGIWGGLKKFGLGKAAMIGAGTAGVLAPFMAGGDEDEEVIDDWSVTSPYVDRIRRMARDQDASLAFLPQSQYVQPGYYTGQAEGGIVGLANGGAAGNAQAEQMLRMEYQKYRNQGGTMSYQQFKMAVLQQAQGQGPMAQGQQAPQGYANGELVEDASMIEETPTGMMAENVEEVQGEPTREQMEALAMEIFQLRLEELDEEQLMVVYQAAMEQQPQEEMMQEEAVQFAANGGIIGSHVPGYTTPPGYNRFDYPSGGVRVRRAEGGIMDLGGVEKDYRQEGGFVPLGKEEKADDVPARLSKNEFVFTADAVRNAGGGDIDAGAEVMQNMMENLEQGGEISEESQGAQGMYNNMQQLQSRIV